MTAINRLPLGILGFLGIKNGGRYPEELPSVLSPTWDFAEQYLATNSEVASNVLAIAAVGYQAFFTVPNGELWYVRGLSFATGTLGAGVTLQLGIAWTDPSSTVTVGLRDPSDAQTTGARALVCLPETWIATPGSTIGLVCTRLAAGPVNVTGAVRFARMTV